MDGTYPMNGLVLCGGKSSRLGFDKLNVTKDNIPIYQWWQDVLKTYCQQIFISCNLAQQQQYNIQNALLDLESNQGPLGGIYSSIIKYPKYALLVVACDLVYVNKQNLELLILSRDPSLCATSFVNTETGLPFPLFTIYEPRIFNDLIHEYENSKRSALTVLNLHPTKLISQNINTNGINTLEEFELWQKSI